MSLKLGLGLHWDEHTPYHRFIGLAEEAESLGYDQIWISNEKFYHDMYVAATAVAEHTRQVRIGTFVADPYTHHPALTAMGVATLDEVSGGRAILGIGAGGTGFPEMGITRTKPAQAIKEAIHVIRGLWRGETVDFEGEVISCHQARLSCRVRPGIPIVVASRGDRVLQVAGEVADGAMVATYAEPDGFRHALSQVELGARRAGRTLEQLAIFTRVDACISQDRRQAMDAVREMVAIMLWTSYPNQTFVRQAGLTVPPELESILARRDYHLMVANARLVPDAFVESFCWAGTAQDVAVRVVEIAKIGVENITFVPNPPAGGDIRETMVEFATTVTPMVERMLGP
jgi:5,10-methylenetetrahydromethanopterin reductase